MPDLHSVAKRTLATSVPAQIADAFKLCCERQNESPGSVIRYYVLSYLRTTMPKQAYNDLMELVDRTYPPSKSPEAAEYWINKKTGD